MRFFRPFFWITAFYHVAFGMALMILPARVSPLMQYQAQLPLSLIQSLGLFIALIGMGYAYVAEQPAKSLVIVALGSASKVMLPLFTYFGYLRGEIHPGAFYIQLFEQIVWLPFFAAYFFWFYRKPRPEQFIPFMGVFGTYFRNR